MLRERRAWLFGGALALALAALAWTWFGPAAAAPSTSGTPGVATRRAGREAPLPPAETVRLAALEQPRDEPTTAARNPFQFGRRGPAPGGPAAPAPPAPVFQPTDAGPAGPSGPAPPAPIPLKFIGVVETAGGTMLAVLVPRQGNASSPMHGREGDIIDGRYRIVKIGTESIEMTYVDGSGRQTIRLTGQ